MLPCRIIGFSKLGDDKFVQMFAPNEQVVGECLQTSEQNSDERNGTVESKGMTCIEKIYDVLISGGAITDLTNQQQDTDNEKKLLYLTKEFQPMVVNLEKKFEATLNENQHEIIYLLNKNCIVFVNVNIQVTLLTVLCYNFYENSVKKLSFNAPFKMSQLATCKFVLVSDQLFICCKSPIHLCLVNFSNDIHSLNWSSEGNASRFLICENNVVIINNQHHSESFLCLTFHRGKFHELLVKKHQIFLEDECYELPRVLNVRGKVIWIAQRENLLKFLQIKGDCLEVFKTYDFNSSSNHMKVQVKNVFYSSQAYLLVPLFCVSNDNDCSLASGYEIAVIDTYTFDLSFFLKADLALNLYSDTIHIAVFHHGLIACVKVLRRSATGLKSVPLAEYIYSIKPRSLMELTRAAVLNTFSLNEIKTLDLPKVFYRLVR